MTRQVPSLRGTADTKTTLSAGIAWPPFLNSRSTDFVGEAMGSEGITIKVSPWTVSEDASRVAGDFKTGPTLSETQNL